MLFFSPRTAPLILCFLTLTAAEAEILQLGSATPEEDEAITIVTEQNGMD